MPQLLYIDTSGNTATVALSKAGRTIASRRHEHTREQAAVLNLMIEDLFTEAQIALDQTDAICVCAGPGSYTGLRVGLSTAKGLCYAMDKPILLFNRMDILAAEFHKGEPIALLLKARAEEYFFALYNEALQPLRSPQHISIAELTTVLEQEQPDLTIITDDEHFTLKANKTLISATHPVQIEKWLLLAEQRFAAKQFDDLAYCEPFYLKAAYTTQSKK